MRHSLLVALRCTLHHNRLQGSGPDVTIDHDERRRESKERAKHFWDPGAAETAEAGSATGQAGTAAML